MNLLAIESSTEACSVALEYQGQLYSRYELAPQQHAQRLFPMMNELLHESGATPKDLDGICYAHGPGSFTGVRIAASLVQGIALGCDIPVVGVSTLKTIAHYAWRKTGHTHILSAIDARMGEVYWGAYQIDSEGCIKALLDEEVISPDEVKKPDTEGPWVGAGSGWEAHKDALHSRCEAILHQSLGTIFPSAKDVLLIARDDFLEQRAVSPENAMPVYLRNKVALTEKERGVR